MVKVKVGVCQCASQQFNIEKMLLHLEEYCRQASLKGVELPLFPEHLLVIIHVFHILVL
jgi:predicted amidohydrolase